MSSYFIIKSKRYGDKKCYFDKEYKEIISRYKWHLLPNKAKTVFYAVANNKGILMHRLITRAPKGMDVDHINHNGLDNRLSNLVVCSHKENMFNQSLRKNSTTGYPNVYIKDTHRKKKWFAKFGNVKTGCFYTIEEAIKARDELKSKLNNERKE